MGRTRWVVWAVLALAVCWAMAWTGLPWVAGLAVVALAALAQEAARRAVVEPVELPLSGRERIEAAYAEVVAGLPSFRIFKED